jgi:hypothetical protein
MDELSILYDALADAWDPEERAVISLGIARLLDMQATAEQDTAEMRAA